MLKGTITPITPQKYEGLPGNGFYTLPKDEVLHFRVFIRSLIPSLLCWQRKLNSLFPGAVISRLAQDSWCLNTLILSLHSSQTSMAAAVATSPRQQPPVSCFAHKPREGKSHSLDLQRGRAVARLMIKHRAGLSLWRLWQYSGARAWAHVHAQERKKERKKTHSLRHARVSINTCKDGGRGKTDGPHERSPFFSRSVREGKGRFPSLSVRRSLLTFLNEWKIR